MAVKNYSAAEVAIMVPVVAELATKEAAVASAQMVVAAAPYIERAVVVRAIVAAQAV